MNAPLNKKLSKSQPHFTSCAIGLMQYEYRTTITWEIFDVVGVGALFATILTAKLPGFETSLDEFREKFKI